MKLLILHGPNLNLLGEREPSVYGAMTLSQLNAKIRSHCRKKNITVKIFQSNSEGRLIDLIHAHRRWADGLVINPGAYTHYSYAIRDAIKGSRVPAVETHLSNIKKREPFRRKSVIAPVCAASRFGKGLGSYLEAVDFLARR
jgi:3-dehydroquinate dehydratase II